MDWLVHYWKIVKEYGRDYVLENTGLKVLALLITAVLWLSVASRPVSQIPVTNVPIEFVNLSQSPVLAVSKYDTLTARVFVEGPRDVLDSLRPSQLTVVADMTGVEPGVRVIPLKLDPSRLPASVKLRDIEPQTIRVTVEKIIERDVPVKPRLEGHVPAGFELLGSQVIPSTVKISGVESQVREANEVSTETVSLNDRTASFRERVAIDIGQPNLNIADDGAHTVLLDVTIGETQKERTFEKVPVILQNSPRNSGSIVGHVTVIIKGPQSAVDQMTAEDVTAIIDYRQDGIGGNRFAPEVTVSPAYSDRIGVESFEPKSFRVR
jgi:YbbR domain-containing protein